MIPILKPRVDIIAELKSEEMEPVDLIVYGAYATIKKNTSLELKRMDQENNNVEKRRKRLLNVTLESGHLSVLDQAVYSIYVSDIPRLATMFMVQPIFMSHLQQSMRRVEPYGVYLPDEIRDDEIINAMDESIDLYYKMVEEGIPKEDARYVIPLYTSTNIQSVGNLREITHLHLISQQPGIPKVCREIVKEIIDKINSFSPELIKNYGENFNILKYYPMPNIFRFEEIIVDKLAEEGINRRLLGYTQLLDISEEELYNALKEKRYSYLMQLRNNTYNVIVKMSFSAFHQAIRQRTLNHIPESIYHALQRFDITIPPSIARSRFKDRFVDMVKKLYKIYREKAKTEEDKTLYVGIVSHAHNIYDIVRLDGWNIVGSLPTRRCIKAQWEIRRVVGNMILEVKKVNEVLPKYSLPGCITFGRCPEKYPCDYKEEFEARGPLIK